MKPTRPGRAAKTGAKRSGASTSKTETEKVSRPTEESSTSASADTSKTPLSTSGSDDTDLLDTSPSQRSTTGSEPEEFSDPPRLTIVDLPAPKKMGRPSKITETIITEYTDAKGKTQRQAQTVGDAVVETIRIGNAPSDAAKFAGVDERTFYRWLEKGDPEHPDHKDDENFEVYRQFRLAVEKAEAEVRTHDIAYITAAIRSGTWQAAAWRLERRAPELYGRREHLVVKQEIANQIAMDMVELLRQAVERHVTDPELRKAVLKDVIESGLAGSPAPDRSEGSS